MTKHGGFWGSANKDTYSKSNKSSTGAGKGAQGMDRRQLTLGSLFDGIAGFPLAAAEAGIRTAWTSEVKPACIRISARHFPEAEQLGDITKLDGAAVPPVDIISFGSPCQNLSAAGDREGLCGEKSKLFFEAVRIIDGMRSATNGRYPKYVIWENVAGAFSSNKGEDFRRVLEEITKAGIPMPRSGRWAAAGMVGDSGGSTAWRMLDAQYWGVPQRRKRIYLVRSFGNGRAGQILFECESVLGYSAQGRGEAEGDTAGIEDCVTGTDSGGLVQDADGQMTLDFGSAGNRVYINAKKSVALKATDGGGGASTGLYLLPVYTVAGNIIGRTGKNGGNQLGIKGDGISPTLTVNDRRAVIYAPEEMQCPAAYMQHGYSGYKKGVGTLRGSRGTNGGGSETLIVNKKKGIKLLKYSVRRLMPVECERLNGFPDGWTQQDINGKPISDNARYTALGNSIAVPCAVRVFRGITAAEGWT